MLEGPQAKNQPCCQRVNSFGCFPRFKSALAQIPLQGDRVFD
jgi:hypothetical protein